MQSHEYRVLPAPRRGPKVKGVRRAEDRFAHAIEAEMNRMAAEGWEFVRSDTLPSERKKGWFSRPVTVPETVLVFRRPHGAQATPRANAAAMPPPVALGAPAPSLGPAAHAPPQASAPPPAPAASRFTPALGARRPANDAPPVAMPPALALVEEPPSDPSAEPPWPNTVRATD
jgi:hypothetical protein